MPTMSQHRSSLSFRSRKSSSSAGREAHDSMMMGKDASQNFLTRLRARKYSVHQNSITPAEAVWFLSLPEKVRRQHFTREEQILIRAKSELALLGTAPEILKDVEDSQQQTLTPPHPHPRSKSVAYDTRQPLDDIPAVPAVPKIHSLQARRSFIAPPSSDTHKASWAPSPTALTPEPLFAQTTPPQRTFLRSPTLNQNAWERFDLSLPPPSETAKLNYKRAQSMSYSSRRADPPSPIQIQKPLYVKDPQTKLFLRDCLKDGKFEETLNFGFPLAPLSACDAVSPGTKIRLAWLENTAQKNDEDEYLDNEGVTELSSADEVMPPTPDSSIAPRIVKPREPDYFSSARRSHGSQDEVLSPGTHRAPSYFEELMSRDMTLRMTLTKPELRASEEELYGWQDDYEEVEPQGLEKDPLALEDLVFSDDVSGLNGTFAQALAKKKGIRGIWFRR